KGRLIVVEKKGIPCKFERVEHYRQPANRRSSDEYQKGSYHHVALPVECIHHSPQGWEDCQSPDDSTYGSSSWACQTADKGKGQAGEDQVVPDTNAEHCAQKLIPADLAVVFLCDVTNQKD